MPCVRLWFAINFFSSCFYILLCLLAITPLWSIATETTEMGHFDLESSVEISEQKVQHSYLLQRKKKWLQSNADCRAYSDHAVKKAKSK